MLTQELAFPHDIPAGFSVEAWEVVQRKPMARIADFTAGNRHIHKANKFSDEIIFIDKEPDLKIPPDLLCRWDEVPNHFPRDYFHCGIIDPPHFWRGDIETPQCKWIHKYPKEDSPVGGSWWGYFVTKRQMVSELKEASRNLAMVTPRLCLKWFDGMMSLNNVLGLFKDEWVEQTKFVEPSGGLNGRSYRWNKRNDAFTWWVKLVRRTVDDKLGTVTK